MGGIHLLQEWKPIDWAVHTPSTPHSRSVHGQAYRRNQNRSSIHRNSEPRSSLTDVILWSCNQFQGYLTLSTPFLPLHHCRAMQSSLESIGTRKLPSHQRGPHRCRLNSPTYFAT